MPRWMVLIFAAVFLSPSYAYAYLDAEPGTMLIQGLVAVGAGLAVLARTYWRKVKALPETGAAEQTPAVAQRAQDEPEENHDEKHAR